MCIENYISNMLIVDRIKNDKQLKIRIEDRSLVIYTGTIKCAKYPYSTELLLSIYAATKNDNHRVAAQVMSLILGAKK